MIIASTPKRIVCLTEESVETLFSLGKGELVVGVSAYVERPLKAKDLPVVCSFIKANSIKIASLEPDLVLGFSDVQKDIARELVEKGFNVFISNHRTIQGIFDYIKTLSSLVGAVNEGDILLSKLNEKIKKAKDFSSLLKKRPKVYIEEWDEPLITGIGWFSEVVSLCGGDVIHLELSHKKAAMDRVVSSKFIIESNPDIIFGCWCGKPLDKDVITRRNGWSKISAVKNENIFELDPIIFLQPGPAPILDGIDKIIEIFENYNI